MDGLPKIMSTRAAENRCWLDGRQRVVIVRSGRPDLLKRGEGHAAVSVGPMKCAWLP